MAYEHRKNHNLVEVRKTAKEAVEGAVETGLAARTQPWMAIFTLLSYCVGVFGIQDEKALVLYGMILACLGFVMVSNYKHKETIKEIVAPWLVEQLLKTLSDYLGTPVPPSETPDGVVVQTPDISIKASAKEMQAELRAKIEMLEAALSNGKGNSSGDA